MAAEQALSERRRQWLKERLPFDFASRIYIYSVLVGIVAGLGAVAFTYGLNTVRFFLWENLAGFPLLLAEGEITLHYIYAEGLYAQRTWLLVLLPAVGALISAYLVYRFAPEAEGSGIDVMIDAFHHRRGHIRPRVPLVKAISTMFVLGSGGSAGKQGPVALIGAGLGAWIGARLKLSVAQRRILLLAGTAGGLGAIFRAPLGGAITSVEVLYQRDFESDALIPCVLSSIVAYSVYTAFFGFGHVFELSELEFSDGRQLLMYMVLGVVCALGGAVTVKVFNFFRDRLFNQVKAPKYLVVALGGLLVGCLGWVEPRILGTGFGVIQQGLHGELTLWVFLALALLKVLATSCTVGSGGSGGLFGPALFIGGMLGGAVGLVGQQFFPALVPQPAAFIVVGMASFFAGLANAPLGALILVTEMTDTYHLLPPLMLVCAFTLVRGRKSGIYKNQVLDKFHSPAHVKDFTVDVLEKLQAGAVCRHRPAETAAVTQTDMLYFSLRALSKKLRQLHFVVLDAEDRVRGMVSLDDLEIPEDDPYLRNLVLVTDLYIEEVEPIDAEDNLHLAMEKLLDSDFDKLPVVHHGEEEVFLGYLMYQDILQAYNDEVERLGREV